MFGLEMFGLEYFSASALWSPFFIVTIIIAAAAYMAIVGPYRHRFAGSEPVLASQKISFLCGLLMIYIAHGSPLDLMGHLMFSAHMTSMSVAYLIAPPLLWLGTPGWLVRPLFVRIFRTKLRHLFHPIVTLILFNALFSFYHMPFIHDTIMTNYTLHTIYYIILYIAALLMWWPISGPLPEYNRLSDLKRLGYVFANGVLLTPACALIIFAGSTLYGTYSDPQIWAEALGFCVPGNAADFLKQFSGPEFFSLIPPIHDQQLGGVIMKLTQELMYGSILFYIFAKWYRSENRKDSYDKDDDLDVALEGGGLNRA